MKRLLVLLVAASFTLTLSGSIAGARSNYKIKGEVRPQSGGYRHVVIVKNKSRNWLNCDVWTDVDPTPSKAVRVGPRNTYEVVIRTRAEEDTFMPYGYCRFN
jgi:hypothetical protein